MTQHRLKTNRLQLIGDGGSHNPLGVLPTLRRLLNVEANSNCLPRILAEVNAEPHTLTSFDFSYKSFWNLILCVCVAVLSLSENQSPHFSQQSPCKLCEIPGDLFTVLLR